MARPQTVGRFENAAGALSALSEIHANYRAAQRSGRYVRRRTGLAPGGGSADYHVKNEMDYWQIVERARSHDRDDALPGQMVDRVKLNTLQGGIMYDPQTGDKKLDVDLYDRWVGWCNDPRQCDAAWEDTFDVLMEKAFRAQMFDGDMIALGLKSGHLQMRESHLIRTPSGLRRTVVLGVELDKLRRHVAYWVAPDNIDPCAAAIPNDKMVRYETFTKDGLRQVFHFKDPKRVSQTRGISAFASVFDIMGMFEDLNFTNLVRAQGSACFMIFRKRDATFNGVPTAQQGERSDEIQGDGSIRKIEDLSPGMQITGQPGESLEGFSPNVPNVEFFQHAKLLITLIGAPIGMPYVMTMLEAGETNFSGWRGAVDQARSTFKSNQRNIIRRGHSPINRWKINQWMDEDSALERASKRRGINIFACQWNAPAWQSIQPKDDATADTTRLEEKLTSPRRLQNENGRDWETLASEIAEDNGYIVRQCWEKAEQLNKECPGINLTWRDVYLAKEQSGKGQGGMAEDETRKPKPEAA